MAYSNNSGVTTASEYTRSYTTFSGCDIVATVVAEIQGITVSINREKAPVYTFGSAEPRSISRGKRGIAGTIVFTLFDRDALVDALAVRAAKAAYFQRIGGDLAVA